MHWTLQARSHLQAAGVVLGLVVGKPLGVVLASLLAVKLGIAALPRGVGLRGLVVVGLVAGVGFTMALFVAGLAFQQRGTWALPSLRCWWAPASQPGWGWRAGWCCCRARTPGTRP